MTIVDVTEEAAEKARKWNWPIPKVIARWLQKNEVCYLQYVCLVITYWQEMAEICVVSN